jgi:hypothetical protein
MTGDPTVDDTLARRRPIRERVDLADTPDDRALAEKLSREAASFLNRRPRRDEADAASP